MIPSCTLLFSHDQTQVVSLGQEYYRDEVYPLRRSHQGVVLFFVFLWFFFFLLFLLVTVFTHFYTFIEHLHLLTTVVILSFNYLNMIFFSYLNIFIMIEVLTKSNIREIFLTTFSPLRMSHTSLIPYMAYNFVVAVKSRELI